SNDCGWGWLLGSEFCPMHIDGDQVYRCYPTSPTAPATAAAVRIASGCSLLFRNNAAAMMVTRPAVQSTVVLTISSAALAMISPAVTGFSPFWIALRHSASLKRYQTPATSNVRMDDGSSTEPVVTSAPATPATRQPTRLTTIMFGPGAACASAYSAAKSCG